MVTPYWKIYFRIKKCSEDGRRRINDIKKSFLGRKTAWDLTPERRYIRKGIGTICTIMASLGKGKWESLVFLFWK